jgi:hypothetical protein
MSTTIPSYLTFRGTLANAEAKYIKTGIAATEIPFGAFVTRAADGTIEATPSVTGQHAYLGVAVDDAKQQKPYDGFYAAGKIVPYVSQGSAYAWLLGGEVALAGDFFKLGAALGSSSGTTPLGVLTPETTVTRTLASVARFLGPADAGDAAYDQTISATTSATGTTVTCAGLASLTLKEGTWVVIASSENCEVNRVVNPALSTTTFTVEKNVLTHTTSPKVYQLVPIQVELI